MCRFNHFHLREMDISQIYNHTKIKIVIPRMKFSDIYSGWPLIPNTLAHTHPEKLLWLSLWLFERKCILCTRYLPFCWVNVVWMNATAALLLTFSGYFFVFSFSFFRIFVPRLLGRYFIPVIIKHSVLYIDMHTYIYRTKLT